MTEKITKEQVLLCCSLIFTAASLIGIIWLGATVIRDGGITDLSKRLAYSCDDRIPSCSKYNIQEIVESGDSCTSGYEPPDGFFDSGDSVYYCEKHGRVEVTCVEWRSYAVRDSNETWVDC